MIEDGEDPTRRLAGLAPVIPPHVLRKRLGMTQAEFARALRIPLATLRNWEQGRVFPDPAARAPHHSRTQPEGGLQGTGGVGNA
jgi:putative transcriptional regulator